MNTAYAHINIVTLHMSTSARNSLVLVYVYYSARTMYACMHTKFQPSVIPYKNILDSCFYTQLLILTPFVVFYIIAKWCELYTCNTLLLLSLGTKSSLKIEKKSVIPGYIHCIKMSNNWAHFFFLKFKSVLNFWPKPWLHTIHWCWNVFIYVHNITI